MENDKPISQFTDDKLNRKTFVKALAVEVENIKERDCRVVGLYGKWGSGKTSIIKLLDEELKTRYFFKSYFNPWRYKSEDILLKELFLKILEGTQSDKKLESSIQELGKHLDDYSQYISVPKASFWGIAFDFTNPAKGLGKSIARLFKGNDSFDNKKSKINEVLTNLALPLIIFIDDVDRLDVTEIQSLFKLIKLTADFNNLVYVIAFDDEMVSKALAKNYGVGDVADGRGFLEK
ncbi:MAG: P-loop NTPase fold protein, partial [Flammeovirgaceae bacterium]